MIRKAFENRSDSDYAIFTGFAEEEVQEMLSEMKDFIQALENFINTSA